MSVILDPDYLRRTARARDRFLSGEHEDVLEGEAQEVRSSITTSWMRSHQFGVDPNRRELPSRNAAGQRTRLYRAARPVLDEMSRHLADMSTALLLADREGMILGRWVGEKSLERLMDSTNSAPGFSLSEDAIGTNGLGSVIEEQRPYAVIGPEHYADLFMDYSCYGAPIIHPRTGRVEGVLTFVCRLRDSSPLMLPFVTMASSQVGERITNGSEQQDKRAFNEFRTATRNSRHPTLMFGDNYVIANARGADLLSQADPDALWGLANQDLGRKAASTSVELADGKHAFATVKSVSEADVEVGTLIKVVVADEEEPAGDSSGVGHHLLADLRERICGNDPVWDSLLLPVINAAQLGAPILIVGDRGTGKAEFAQALHETIYPDSPLIALHAGLADISGTRRWLSQVRESLRSPGTVLIEHVGALDDHAAELLSTLIEEASAHDPRQFLSTFAGDPRMAGLNPTLEETLAAYTLSIPRMQDRIGDLPCLLNRFAEQLGVEPLHLSPEALQTLRGYSWPGNLKQVRRFVQMMRSAQSTGSIGVRSLPADMQVRDRRVLGEIERLERQAIVNALARCNGNKSTAAQELGVSRATLYRKIKTYRLT